MHLILPLYTNSPSQANTSVLSLFGDGFYVHQIPSVQHSFGYGATFVLPIPLRFILKIDYLQGKKSNIHEMKSTSAPLAEEKTYHVEVLQVADVPTLNDVYTNIVAELEKTASSGERTSSSTAL